MLALLLTDYLIWGLVLMVVLFAVYASRHQHLRRPWAHVFQSQRGAVASVVLGVYLFIGLADSIHYYPKQPIDAEKTDQIEYAVGERHSVFDHWATAMRTQVETSYSAPFAMTGLSKQTFEHPQGGQVREYPRLTYAGRHLKADDNRGIDILCKAGIGSLQGIGIWLLLLLVVSVIRTRGHAVAAFTAIKLGFCRHSAWRSAWLTGLFMAVVLGAMFYLSQFYHVFGTDKVGYDVFYATLKSIRTGLIIGTLTTLIMLPLALLLGIAAGYFGGWVDDLVQYAYTTLNSIPGVLLIAASVLMLDVYMHQHPELFTSVLVRADWRLFFICLILGVTSWTSLCRLLRAETLKLREMDYVAAAQVLGVKHGMILVRHMLPNVMPLVLISMVLDFSGLVLAEAVLSYVNIGVDPTTYSWGNMVNAARLEMAREPVVWWSLAASLVAMFVLVLFANLFADAVRDAFDPRLEKAYPG